MKLFYGMMSVCLVMILSGCGKSGEDGGFDASMDFVAFTEKMDPSKNTTVAIREFWSTQTGRRVTWEGIVVDVRGSRDRVDVQIRNDARPAYRGYNIILSTFDKSGAAALKKGEKIKFRGMPTKYREHRGNVIVISLGEGELVN